MGLKIAIITGSTGAIGKAIVRQVLAKGDYSVIMVARDEAKAVKVKEEVIRATGNEHLQLEIVDLSRKQEIFQLAARTAGPVHLLINDAAQSPRSRSETPEGIELQWATNVLGYFWMIEAFTPHLMAGTPSRIVNVASYWAGGLDLGDPEFRKRSYNNDTAYRQSKQADRMLSASFAQKLKDYHITVNACHPGDVNSRLSKDLGYGGHETPDQGADTPVWLATSPELQVVTGKYFEHRRVQDCNFSRNISEVEKLIEICKCY